MVCGQGASRVERGARQERSRRRGGDVIAEYESVPEVEEPTREPSRSPWSEDTVALRTPGRRRGRSRATAAADRRLAAAGAGEAGGPGSAAGGFIVLCGAALIALGLGGDQKELHGARLSAGPAPAIGEARALQAPTPARRERSQAIQRRSPERRSSAKRDKPVSRPAPLPDEAEAAVEPAPLPEAAPEPFSSSEPPSSEPAVVVEASPSPSGGNGGGEFGFEH